MAWEKIKLKTESKGVVEGIAPLIISASRSTDIPAFHAEWFIKRLEKGYAAWQNPFNRKLQYVSFKNTRVIVFWTKNPAPLIKYLDVIERKNINYYFQYTLNNYEKENLEPDIPELAKRRATFKELSERVGKEKVIWRFDPLILTPETSVADLLNRVEDLGRELVPYTNSFVFSYADVMQYKKVQNNLIRNTDYYTKDNIGDAEFSPEQKTEFAEGMREILSGWNKINPRLVAATCAEDIDLSAYGIKHNKCIDDELMTELFADDKLLMNFLGYKPEKTGLFAPKPKLKDKGQRPACGCIVSKDIGAYNTCRHLCVYCYANTSLRVVEKNFSLMTGDSEGILKI